LKWLLALLAVWAVVSYLVVPLIWKEYFHDHSKLAEAPRITHTGDGHPGDAINIALVGTESELISGMTAAGWFPADPITLASSIRIVVDSVFSRPDDQAPVSNLFLFGRKQDLAFERPVGDNPRQRHHVRFWRWDKQEHDRPVWFGSATFDESVGVSHTTGQVTHHTGPDLDAERDLIAGELRKAGWVQQVRWRNDFQQPPEGRNGGGDPWHTDGRLAIVELEPRAVPVKTP
jgi:hypothetical protein